ncbi:MAG TPA: DUF1329 domain-containing protein [Methylibium sp.]|nr:DUF1329 domain-containing protein [Methylibium sp.]
MSTAIRILAAVLAGGVTVAAQAQTTDDTFFPYRKGFPSLPGLTSGTVINKGNVDKFKDALDAANYKLIKDGWYEITVSETFDFPNAKGYVEATKQHGGKAKLGPKVGNLEGYVAGRPFPEEPSTSDPRAGEKVIWNFKYGINWGDNAAIYPFYWKYKNAKTGNVDRTLKFNFHFLNFTHRTDHQPLPEVTPNSSNLFRAIYAQVLEPQDLKNTQLLIQKYEDDTKFDDAYLYLGFQRRVRRLAAGQVTDAFLGSDVMIEDFEGYESRVSDYKWSFLGAKNILMPYYKHNDMALTDEHKDPSGYKFVDFQGKGGCAQKITWQLRKVYELQGEPLNPAHPIGKRLMYLDAQVYGASRNITYDRKGEIWKTFSIGKAHPDHHLPINKGSGIALDDSFSMIDMQAERCTTGQFKGQIDPKLSPASMFQVQYMRGGD